MSDAGFRLAASSDEEAVMSLMRRYYAEDGYPFDETDARAAFRLLLDEPDLGWLWLIERRGQALGYLVVTLGFSFEYRGRDAFIDELYLLPAARGRGIGARAMAIAEARCRDAGVRAIHLEVEADKPQARRLYAAAGFRSRGRLLMSRLLADA